ncbi:oxidoreductase [Pyrobaculum calidifontis]|uniref:NADH:flavin oxidoreductase/NADH oxidase n=1 Tax=Pyrobaculum calidifontis (strain DSM 21063 / JCM 11548 / VA1) TaxID=410359 RepID=A3MWB5_PYRCJ|nr:FAD-dependent oxidoreductase [Pyrobaculum calidifontis]ABO08932.1 NADH:flavin oxidoreductase/NADH oxidase [Pyrobaculum calidifontis JCM 11548]
MKLFEEGFIAGVRVPNRIVVAPLGAGLAQNGFVTPALIQHYVELAEAEPGLVVVEGAAVSEDARDSHGMLAIYDDAFVGGLSLLVDEIKARGPRVAIQLLHPGGAASPRVRGNVPVAPTAMEYLLFVHGRHAFKAHARELTREEIKRLVEKFAEAAGRAKDAGFDFVQINAGHGWLFSQFLSPRTNKRSDEYGGPIENRIRFAIEVAEAVKSQGIPPIFRIDAVNPAYGGVTEEEVLYFAKRLEEAGAAAIEASGGPAPISPAVFPQGLFLEGAAKLKKALKIPVIAIGALDHDLANKALEEGLADFVAFGRAFIADPQWPIKLRQGRPEDIRPCVRCNECIDRGFSLRQLPPKCAVNPQFLRFAKPKPPTHVKTVVVVGGGPAGMEAARVAAERGHRVVLYEQSHQLGGNLIPATASPFKQDLRRYLEWLRRQVHKAGVEVRLGTRPTPEEILSQRPDAVILALGSEPATPNIPGIEQGVYAVDVLLGKAKAQGRVVVLGGGRVGGETALHLALEGAQVAIVEILPDIMTDLERSYRLAMLGELKRRGVSIYTNFRTLEVRPGRLYGLHNGNPVEVPFDTLVIATGMRPRDTAPYRALAKHGVEVYEVGDCVRPRNLYAAVHEAYNVASRL